MSPQKPYSLVVIGSGPGIGTHVASLFASKRFAKVALIARNPEQLAKDKAQVEQAAPGKVTVKTYPLDITNLPKLSAALERIGAELGTPECVFYNAGLVRPSKLLEYDEQEMLLDFKASKPISTIGLHATAKWAVPQLIDVAKSDTTAKPSILITSSLLPTQPDTSIFSLSVAKAAQMNLAKSMALTYESQGVHVGLVVVGGDVHPSNRKLNPLHIAERTWELFDQPRDAHTFTVEILEN